MSRFCLFIYCLFIYFYIKNNNQRQKGLFGLVIVASIAIGILELISSMRMYYLFFINIFKILFIDNMRLFFNIFLYLHVIIIITK
jgi:hypothetical protein